MRPVFRVDGMRGADGFRAGRPLRDPGIVADPPGNQPRMKFGGLVVLAALMTGCASNLAQMQTARALEPGQLRVSGGVGYYIPATQLGNMAGDGISVAKQGIESAVNDTPLE